MEDTFAYLARLDTLKVIMVTYEHVTKTKCSNVTWKDLYRSDVFPVPVLLCPKCNEPIIMKVEKSGDIKDMHNSIEITQSEYDKSTREYLDSLPTDKVDLLYRITIKELEDNLGSD